MSNDEYFGPLFDVCGNYHKGNPQSIEANRKVDKTRQRTRILHILRAVDDMTCEQIEDFTGLPHQSASARISELKRDGLIKQVGTRKTRSGCNAAVYKA